MFHIIISPAQLNLEFFFCFDNFSSLFLHQIRVFSIKIKPLLYSTHDSCDIEDWSRFDDTRVKIKVVALLMVAWYTKPSPQN